MSLVLRIILIVASSGTALFFIIRIKKTKAQIGDSVFWIAFSLLLLLLSVFPDVPIWLSNLVGFQSPLNAVFMVIIFVLIVKLFELSGRVGKLEGELSKVAQTIALDEYEKNS